LKDPSPAVGTPGKKKKQKKYALLDQNLGKQRPPPVPPPPPAPVLGAGREMWREREICSPPPPPPRFCGVVVVGMVWWKGRPAPGHPGARSPPPGTRLPTRAPPSSRPTPPRAPFLFFPPHNFFSQRGEKNALILLLNNNTPDRKKRKRKKQNRKKIATRGPQTLWKVWVGGAPHRTGAPSPPGLGSARTTSPFFPQGPRPPPAVCVSLFTGPGNF